jgi:hypothetical protein
MQETIHVLKPTLASAGFHHATNTVKWVCSVPIELVLQLPR